MNAKESITEFVWATSPSVAWDLVYLSEMSDGDIFQPHVHTSREAAEAAEAEGRNGPTLYRITRTSVLADESTPAPEGCDYVFIHSTPEWHMRWSQAGFEAAEHERLNRVWAFPDAAEAVERAALAMQEWRTDEDTVFRAYLLTWSVCAVKEEPLPTA